MLVWEFSLEVERWPRGCVHWPSTTSQNIRRQNEVLFPTVGTLSLSIPWPVCLIGLFPLYVLN